MIETRFDLDLLWIERNISWDRMFWKLSRHCKHLVSISISIDVDIPLQFQIFMLISTNFNFDRMFLESKSNLFVWRSQSMVMLVWFWLVIIHFISRKELEFWGMDFDLYICKSNKENLGVECVFRFNKSNKHGFGSKSNLTICSVCVLVLSWLEFESMKDRIVLEWKSISIGNWAVRVEMSRFRCVNCWSNLTVATTHSHLQIDLESIVLRLESIVTNECSFWVDSRI